ncbi:putative major facilitator superfamily, MFS transporter superfamily [Helianthus annuus]|uniref:Putative major facilitator superfamily domain protein n=1 Tax=Helianthus annuus TaxID=4232 RepID=A0A251VIJ0_HELAN|nr:putative major facilitator superfamily, MFS transporter superfamily [Helianthus annuus]KAJ0711613.1 putative major facilitator superfamily, MFS transporter superfamily [Helianthus annuus]KAJ0803465.1 putative major facilitator superfamily, MFS transporter superfamily [Helianthus annuus]KAJ0959044.1 putative major facilitator superfamily, MFS transporter superfamily [Helianthus annuus]
MDRNCHIYILYMSQSYQGSAYMIGRALTSIIWGVVADRYGRKPVIILGTSTVFVPTSMIIILALCLVKYYISVVLIKLVCFFMFSRVIFNTMFGFSVNYCMAVITRFLLGFLNGVLGTIKAYACELFPEEHQALGLSATSTSWGIGLIFGPALGGFLAQV